ncbi:TPA: MarR family transcriptional regulator [Candidatus Bathyarchaeota archaeon]|nr:MarR family transcriptional regulator [Candidatus Bathyarchaeota archaeon]
MLDLTVASLVLSLASLIAIAYLFATYKRRKSLDLRGFNDLLQASTMHLVSKLRGIEGRVTEASGRADTAVLKVESLHHELREQDSSLDTLAGSLKTLMEAQVKFSMVLRELRGRLSKVDERLNSVEAAVRSLRRPSTRQPARPIFPKPPSQREISFTSLNPTEMEVLRLLYVSGPKTASEVREVIGRTREHTARLMKKLYLEGYVERSTEVIPFTYKLSEKIKKSLEFSIKGQREVD